MEPKNQECRGLFGYGSGYYAAESRMLARINHRDEPAFCDTCPIKADCWTEHRALVRELHPIPVRSFEDALAAAGPGRGGELAARLMSEGRPDPWMAGMLANFTRGSEDRAALKNVVN